MLRNKKGFTLMEILVVVTIIAILAAIAVPSYLYAVDKGRQDACATNIRILLTQVERYELTTGQKVTLSGDEDLVAFLLAEDYLTGEPPQCPYNIEDNPTYKYVLTYVDGKATITCTHPNKDGK
jgi:prepilin-type N-terminal cleavage/methylation domain-containing protein